MWLIINNEGTKRLCHTLLEVNQFVVAAALGSKFKLEFVPIWTTPEPKKSLVDPEVIREKFPIPLSRVGE
jgi:hypothetical protein